MSDEGTTPIETRATILGDLWLSYGDDEAFKEFVSYNDLGLPLAYALSEGIIDPTKQVYAFINETFDLLLAALGLQDDSYEDLNDMLSAAADE